MFGIVENLSYTLFHRLTHIVLGAVSSPDKMMFAQNIIFIRLYVNRAYFFIETLILFLIDQSAQTSSFFLMVLDNKAEFSGNCEKPESR